MSKEDNLFNSLYELITKTSTQLPDDVTSKILEATEKEDDGSNARYALGIIGDNIKLAKDKAMPLCQDTGTLIVYCSHSEGFVQSSFKKTFEKAVIKATENGVLRQNSVESLTNQNTGNNLGLGHPSFHFHEDESLTDTLEVKMMLKGGGCENVGIQYSLPHTELAAGRDLEGVRRVLLDAVFKAQGKGCGPGVLGVCVGGDRGAGFINSKEQLFRKLNDKNVDPTLNELEDRIVKEANAQKIGPMGFGGNTTLLGCKIGVLNRLPASYFVSVSYMCWAYRRQGCVLSSDHSVKNWIY